MEAINTAEYRRRLKKGVSGAYIFFGDEEYMKRFCLTETRKSIAGDADTAAFNIISISCDDSMGRSEEAVSGGSAGYIAEAAAALSSPPLFADKKLVELHDFNFSKLSDQLIGALVSLAENMEEDSTFIIFCRGGEIDVGTLPMRPSKLYSSLSEVYTFVSFEPEPPAKLSSWIQRHFTSEGIAAENPECYALMSRCGHSMFILSGEISKLICYLKARGRDHLREDDIKEVTCAYTESADFGLSNALQAGDAVSAFAEIGLMKAAHEKPEIMLASITRLITDVYTVQTLFEAGMTRSEIASGLGMKEARIAILGRGIRGKSTADLALILDHCLDADLKIKTTSADSYMIIDRLCAEIF